MAPAASAEGEEPVEGNPSPAQTQKRNTQTKTATRVRTYRCVLLCTAFGDTTLYMCARLRQCLRAHAYVRLQPICVHTYAALTAQCFCVSACMNIDALILDRNRCSAHDQRPFKSRRNAPPMTRVKTERHRTGLSWRFLPYSSPPGH